MKILGVDYGRAKIGLAVADGPLAEPHSVLRVKDAEDALKKVEQAVLAEQAELVVVGVSEGNMGEEQVAFAKSLEERCGVEVKTWDETLSSLDAQSLSIQTGHGQKKRADMEDAFAAAIMVQSYIDGSNS